MSVVRRWLPVVLWSAVILAASNNYLPSDRTGAALDVLFGIAVPHWVNVAVRKTGHLSGYGLLAFLALRASRVDFRRPVLAALTVTLLVASIDEIHQSTLRFRRGSAWDVVLDVAGGAVAIALAHWRRRAVKE